jgi:aryl-alcohol dehydrogenase-like predicted oxidoreductase
MNRNASQTAIRFVLQQQPVTAAIVGIRTKEQLNDIIAATHTPLLTDNEMIYLRASIPVNYYEQHR